MLVIFNMIVDFLNSISPEATEAFIRFVESLAERF